ncbi:MAG TPA: aminoglycoside phosphotransferase family protein [Candidatus Limiplasma sp.]|nr:aminoglycoside phosphotransferase family protein [Candidatus Limiplasma sp.]
MKNVIDQFPFAGETVFCEPYGSGHINDTYRVVTDLGAQYILQRINTYVFPDVKGLMDNIAAVTAYLGARVETPREAMTLIPTKRGEHYLTDVQGGCWRAYPFIESSVCLQRMEQPADFYECGLAFGRFQGMMTDFPAGTLNETIPDFHNTPSRYEKFKRAIAADRMGRAGSVREEIEFALSLEEEAGRLQRMRRSGELPTRVTHNDTKINNVLLDRYSHKALCVIDLDTVMPGLAAYDFGDSIRFGAATAAEDETDLSRMRLDVGLFEAFSRGFLQACRSLTPQEIETLPLGAFTMTLECGVRFLTDDLEGDHYFKIEHERHNLERCRTQFTLAADIRRHLPKLKQIVACCAQREPERGEPRVPARN